ncbi:ead/Ea22-like family protein [Escherichia coli]|nr:ead/Ea22-like family protein [Escherichia coli]
MSEINYQALREAAEKATCGEWSLEYGESRFDGDDALIHREVAGYIPICRIEGAHPESGFDEDFQMEQQANAEFIAAANPATVLALLDERERNQQYIKRRDQENEDIALTVGKLRVELEAAKKRIAELEAEPVSQTYKLPSLPSSEVNDAAWKLHNMLTEHGPLNGRQFSNLKGCFYEALKVAMRNYPVTPDAWISCSERMPDDGQHVIIICDGAFVLYAQYRDGEFFDVVRDGDEFFETQSRNVTHWMPLPEPPQEVNRG